ncbi:MAG: hypothetical protein E4G99_00465 [Anaerolineales bacterium]|nr:MAG: hypothetical protein E4G99_00465 [Anaerolineales bacterium]
MTWVADGIFAAGGEHIPGTWAAFSQQTGIRAILHLSSGQPQQFCGPAPERFLWLDIEDESEADLEARRLVGEYILSCRAAGHAVLLHSAQGRHRVRWAFVAHQLCSGRKLKPVLRQAAEKPWLAPYHTDSEQWQAFYQYVQMPKPDPMSFMAEP